MEYSKPDVFRYKVHTISFDELEEIAPNVKWTVQFYARNIGFSAASGIIMTGLDPLDQLPCIQVSSVGAFNIICTSEAVWVYNFIWRGSDFEETDKCDKFVPVPRADKYEFEGEELDKYQDWYFPIMENVTTNLRGAYSYFKWCKRTRGQTCMQQIIEDHAERMRKEAEHKNEMLRKWCKEHEQNEKE